MRWLVPLTAIFAIGCLGYLTIRSHESAPVQLLSTPHQKLYYTDRGMSSSEISAVRKSKKLSGEVVEDEKAVPSLVDKFMAALREERNELVATYEYKIAPAIAYGSYKSKQQSAALKHPLQQLSVIMTTCVKCVAECPAYVKHPFKAESFDEFQTMALDKCAMCFHGVSGPCPANKDNHGVLAQRHGTTTTTLSSSVEKKHIATGNGRANAKAVVATGRTDLNKPVWPRQMGTNVVFLDHAN